MKLPLKAAALSLTVASLTPLAAHADLDARTDAPATRADRSCYSVSANGKADYHLEAPVQFEEILYLL